MRTVANVALEEMGCKVSPDAAIGSLSVPQRKQVQLARAFEDAPGLLLIDEPTAVLGDAETQRLFAAFHLLKLPSSGVLYVSRRLDEVLAIADRVTVLRDGRWVSTDAVSAIDKATLVRRMVGRDVSVPARGKRELGDATLRLTDVGTAH